MLFVQELKAKQRTELGKQVNALRRSGFLPAVVYGEGVNSQSISISSKDFEKAYKAAGESTLLALDLEGKKYNVLIYDVAYDPLRGCPVHADFYAVRMDKTIRTKVAIEFIGDAPAVKNFGGIPVKVMQEVEVEAFPQDLPHSLRADLSALTELRAKLFIRDIRVPQGVTLHINPEEIIFLVEAPRSDEELAQLKEAPISEATEVLTEQDVKKTQAAEEKAREEPAAEPR